MMMIKYKIIIINKNMKKCKNKDQIQDYQYLIKKISRIKIIIKNIKHNNQIIKFKIQLKVEYINHMIIIIILIIIIIEQKEIEIMNKSNHKK